MAMMWTATFAGHGWYSILLLYWKTQSLETDLTLKYKMRLFSTNNTILKTVITIISLFFTSILFFVFLFSNVTLADMNPPQWQYRKLTDQGGRVDWYKGKRHNYIAYDAITEPAIFNTDVYIMQPSGKKIKCVTCKSTIPKGFIGQPAWHPDGDHIILQAENKNSLHKSLNHMSFGFDNDLWLIKKDGSNAQLIWSSPLHHAALHPHFNKDGTKLIFAERVPTGKSYTWIEMANPGFGGENHWDGWRIHVADFDINKSGKQMLSNHKILFPNTGGFYETHGFNIDGKIIFSHTANGRPYVDDIYIADTDGSNIKNLTTSTSTWEEHGIFSPSGNAMAFISSKADKTWHSSTSRPQSLKTELFITKKDTGFLQLTTFNSINLKNKRYLVSDFDWNQYGTQIVFQVAPFDLRSGKPYSPQLWILTFTKPQ
jgi:Tol biopolymer transport system component